MINVPLLRKIQQHILEEPARVDMEHWLIEAEEMNTTENKFEAFTRRLNVMGHAAVPACGIVGCIAGWAVVLSGSTDGLYDVAAEAADLLGLDIQCEYDPDHDSVSGICDCNVCVEATLDDVLFLTNHWPQEYKTRIRSTTSGTASHAQVISDFIDYFIATYTKEETANA